MVVWPKCMGPEGTGFCEGFKQLVDENATLRQRNDHFRAAAASARAVQDELRAQNTMLLAEIETLRAALAGGCVSAI